MRGNFLNWLNLPQPYIPQTAQIFPNATPGFCISNILEQPMNQSLSFWDQEILQLTALATSGLPTTSSLDRNSVPPLPVTTLPRLQPSGDLVESEPLRGGGLYGAGFGIGIDPEGQVWVGNFGFGASKVPPARQWEQCVALFKGRRSTFTGSITAFTPKAIRWLHRGRATRRAGCHQRSRGQHLDRQLQRYRSNAQQNWGL